MCEIVLLWQLVVCLKWHLPKCVLFFVFDLVCKASNRENCEEAFTGSEWDICTACKDKFDDKIGCENIVGCFFANGVCVYNA